MKSERSLKAVASRILTTGDLRSFLANVAMGVIHGDMKVAEAVVAVKACEQINTSLYTEAKMRALAAAENKQSPHLGQLPLRGEDAEGTKAA